MKAVPWPEWELDPIEESAIFLWVQISWFYKVTFTWKGMDHQIILGWLKVFCCLRQKTSCHHNYICWMGLSMLVIWPVIWQHSPLPHGCRLASSVQDRLYTAESLNISWLLHMTLFACSNKCCAMPAVGWGLGHMSFCLLTQWGAFSNTAVEEGDQRMGRARVLRRSGYGSLRRNKEEDCCHSICCLLLDQPWH